MPFISNPAADLFPMLEESRLSELVASMRERWGALYGGQWRHVGAESIDLPD